MNILQKNQVMNLPPPPQEFNRLVKKQLKSQKVCFLPMTGNAVDVETSIGPEEEPVICAMLLKLMMSRKEQV